MSMRYRGIWGYAGCNFGLVGWSLRPCIERWTGDGGQGIKRSWAPCFFWAIIMVTLHRVSNFSLDYIIINNLFKDFSLLLIQNPSVSTVESLLTSVPHMSYNILCIYKYK